MATAVRDGAVLANVASVSTTETSVTVYLTSATYQGVDVDLHDGIFVFVNPPASDDLAVQRMIGDAVRHRAGA